MKRATPMPAKAPAQDETEAVRDARMLGLDRDWFGYLTTANYEAITERIRRLIAGKKYTWVASLSPALAGEKAYHHRPEVRTSQEAEKIECKLITGEHQPFAHITVCDSYGVWGLSSHHATQREARDGERKVSTYVHFQRDRWGDKLEIEHYSLSGNHIWWVISVEGHGW